MLNLTVLYLFYLHMFAPKAQTKMCQGDIKFNICFENRHYNNSETNMGQKVKCRQITGVTFAPQNHLEKFNIVILIILKPCN